MRHINPSGYVYYDNEAELCQELEKHFFPSFFDKGYEKEKSPNGYCKKRVDYYGKKDKINTWIEVKNWWVTKSNIKQIINYHCFFEKPFLFYVICGGIIKERQHLLEYEFKVKIIETKDIKEINPKELVYWM